MKYWATIQQYLAKRRSGNRVTSDNQRRHVPLIATFALLLVPASAYGWNAAQASASDSTTPASEGAGDHVQKLLRVDSSAASSASDQTNQQHTSLSVNSSSTSRSENVGKQSATVPPDTGGAQTTVTVNGQTVTLPTNGSLHKDYSDGNGSTSVDVSVSGNGSANSTSSSSINLQITNDSVSSSGENQAL